MSQSLYQVDAFTAAPFAGNPAAVCLLSEARDADWMQDVAAEMNLSETAFLRAQSDGSYRLRWFTPTHEVDLCGHATLASAHVLWTEGLLAPDAEARFETASGRLTATRTEGWITMNFPTDSPSPVEPPPALLEALDLLDPSYVGRSDRDYLLHCHSEEEVRALDPNMTALAAVEGRGVIVTAPSEQEKVDFVSRFFAPGVGVPEDPVTGSAHCALGPYWTEQTGRTTLTGRQVSARGGTVRVYLEAPDADRVALSGQATTVFRGRLTS
jgi:PhzF family phenazine biosynthesis protein